VLAEENAVASVAEAALRQTPTVLERLVVAAAVAHEGALLVSAGAQQRELAVAVASVTVAVVAVVAAVSLSGQRQKRQGQELAEV